MGRVREPVGAQSFWGALEENVQVHFHKVKFIAGHGGTHL